LRKTVQIPGLQANSEYSVQFRGVDAQGGTGQWSTQLRFNTVIDELPPAPVTQLSVTPVGPDFVISWVAPTTNDDGSILDDLRDYQVSITANSVTRVQYTVDVGFTLSFSKNRELFNPARPEISVTVQARDRVGNLSSVVTQTGTNPPPTAPALTSKAKRNAVELFWTDGFSDDGLSYEIWKNGAFYSSVGPDTLTWTDTDVTDDGASPGAQDYYIKAIDVFGQTADSNTITQTEITLDIDSDTIPPKPPTNLGYSDVASGTTTLATLSWDGPTQDTDDTSYTDNEGFQVRYRTDPTRAWTFATVPDERVDATVPQNFELDVSISAGGTLYWGVRAFDRSGNFSDWATSDNAVSEDTTPPNKPSTPSVAGNTSTIQVVHDLKDDLNNPLADTVVSLEVYVGTSTTFGSMTKVGSIDVNRPSLGISAVGSFPFPVTDANQLRYVRVVAVSSAGISSTPSDSQAVTVELVRTANIEDAAITNAKIDSLQANKISAGSAFVNNLLVESEFTIKAGGLIKSDNYDFSSRTGWAVDDGNLFLFSGAIDASKITIQDGANLLDHGYSTFLNDTEWYALNLDSTAAVAQSSLWSRYGTASLNINGSLGERTWFSKSVSYSIAVESSTDYIGSIYVHNPDSSSMSLRLVFEDNDMGLLLGSETTVPAGGTVRLSEVYTTAPNASLARMGIEVRSSTADFYVDGGQFEQRAGLFTEPSTFKVGGVTSISAGQITTGFISVDRLAANSITADKIAANSITANEIAADSITANEIAANSITANEIAADSITANEIAAGTLTSASGVFGTISADDITAGTMNAARINGGTISGVSLSIGAKFTVDSFGNLVANDASISGDVTVTSSLTTTRMAFGRVDFLYDNSVTGSIYPSSVGSGSLGLSYGPMGSSNSHIFLQSYRVGMSIVRGSITRPYFSMNWDDSSWNCGSTGLIYFGSSGVVNMQNISGTPTFRVSSGDMQVDGQIRRQLTGTVFNSDTTEGVTLNSHHIQIARSLGTCLHLNRLDGNGEIVSFRRNGTNIVGSIVANWSNTEYRTTSDYRLKENIRPVPDPLGTLAKIRPVEFDWVGADHPESDHRSSQGVIAHELQEVLPHLVSDEKDAVDEKGNIKPQQVDYSKLVPLLLASVQELSKQVQELQRAG